MASESPLLVLPRGLIFGASLWLIGSWMIAIGVRAPLQASSTSYTPAVRMMLVCVTCGLMIGWPLLRLSQNRPPYPVRQTLLDLVVLLGLVQVVIWPLRLVTNWTPERTAAIDATLACWLFLIGAIITSAVQSDRAGPRRLSMLACLGICLLGPVLAWLGVLSGFSSMWVAEISPLIEVRTLAEAGSTPPTTACWRWIIVLVMANAVAWTALRMTTLVHNQYREV